MKMISQTNTDIPIDCKTQHYIFAVKRKEITYELCTWGNYRDERRS